jgi:hypothetical protein
MCIKTSGTCKLDHLNGLHRVVTSIPSVIDNLKGSKFGSSTPDRTPKDP